ncbi:hypothetical protein Bbelb_151240 [Branchiostoma belcheri]|nr:hypothetical protein Bbelb_151240 [Branchiostoma belcheri]
MVTSVEVSVPADNNTTTCWSTVAKPGATRETVFPVFIMEREVITKKEAYANPIREEKMYHCLIQVINPAHLRSIQRFVTQRCSNVGNSADRDRVCCNFPRFSETPPRFRPLGL